MRKGHRKPKTWVPVLALPLGEAGDSLLAQNKPVTRECRGDGKGRKFLTFTAGPKQIQMPAGAG